MSLEALSKKYTVNEFIALPNDGKRYELVESQFVEMAGASYEQVRAVSRLQVFLGHHVLMQNLGDVLGAEARFAIISNKETVSFADLSFIQNNRVHRNITTMEFAPDLAVEVLSESNTYTEIEIKIAQYFTKGCQMVWVINLQLREVYIYRVGSNLRETLNAHDTLEGDPVVRGFRMEVIRIFE